MLVCQFRHSPIKDRLDTNYKPEKANRKVHPDMLSASLSYTRKGISSHMLLFYHRCLNKATDMELSIQGINDFSSSPKCGKVKFAYRGIGFVLIPYG